MENLVINSQHGSLRLIDLVLVLPSIVFSQDFLHNDRIGCLTVALHFLSIFLVVLLSLCILKDNIVFQVEFLESILLTRLIPHM
jgi:hypothetical protein